MNMKIGAGIVKAKMSYIFATFSFINSITIKNFERISNGFIRKAFQQFWGEKVGIILEKVIIQIKTMV